MEVILLALAGWDGVEEILALGIAGAVFLLEKIVEELNAGVVEIGGVDV